MHTVEKSCKVKDIFVIVQVKIDMGIANSVDNKREGAKDAHDKMNVDRCDVIAENGDMDVEVEEMDVDHGDT